MRTDQRPADEVRVIAPARLHLGFFDLNGALGRRFGSLGITLEDVFTKVVMRAAETLTVTGPEHARAAQAIERLSSALDLPATGALSIERAIPPHVGLGSGTQVHLAVGTAYAQLHGQPASPREIAGLLERGARSGIGIGAFEAGGVLADGGRGSGAELPPIIARHPFPDGWRVLLIGDAERQGIAGGRESQAFAALPPFPSDDAARLCRLMLMVCLPALAEADFAEFSRAVGQLQRVIGDHFGHAQGGRFASPAVAGALDWLEQRGLHGVGQTSWGPTGFALIDEPARAERLLTEVRREFRDTPALSFRLSRGRNRGAEIKRSELGAIAARRSA